jgi:hypothetical protein
MEKLQNLADNIKSLSGYNVDIEEISDPDKQEAIRENIMELFDLSISEKPLRLGWVRYLLRQAASMRTNVLLTKCLTNLNTLVPVMRDLSKYLIACSNDKTTRSIGEALINLIDKSPYGVLPFIRLWVFEVLNTIGSFIFESDIRRLAGISADMNLESRTIATLSKELKQFDWVREQKEIWQNFAPWDKRAVIWAGSILPFDERRNWVSRIENSDDILDNAIAKALKKSQ